jgi:hypothetical protein
MPVGLGVVRAVQVLFQFRVVVHVVLPSADLM